jgi:hypothetical protein
LEREITQIADRAHKFRTASTRKLDDNRVTDIGSYARVRARYWAVEVASVLVDRAERDCRPRGWWMRFRREAARTGISTS